MTDPHEARAALEHELGGPPSPSVRALAPAHAAALAATVRAARIQQAEQLRAATDETFDRLPRLLRGPVRRIVGG